MAGSKSTSAATLTAAKPTRDQFDSRSTLDLTLERYALKNRLCFDVARTHQMPTHGPQRPYKCDHCDSTFLRESHLKAHARTHLNDQDKTLACDSCDKRFWTSQHLRKHIEVVHHGKTYDVRRASYVSSKSPSLILVPWPAVFRLRCFVQET